MQRHIVRRHNPHQTRQPHIRPSLIPRILRSVNFMLIRKFFQRRITSLFSQLLYTFTNFFELRLYFV